MGIMMAGQQAAMGEFLAFTRAQESHRRPAGARLSLESRDQRQGHARFLQQAAEPGISARDLFQGQLRPHPPAFDRAHPGARAEVYKKDPAWGKPTDPALEARFQRVKAKLIGYVDPKQAVIKYPESNQSVPAHYARAYAYHQGGYPDKAVAEAKRLLAIDPQDPFFLELKGQILLEGGKPTGGSPSPASGGPPVGATRR